VLIVADDMGYAHIGIHGSKDIPTPNIDALAKAGVRFTDAYVTGPIAVRRAPD
jgi:arylsulfatase A-like enzyme